MIKLKTKIDQFIYTPIADGGFRQISKNAIISTNRHIIYSEWDGHSIINLATQINKIESEKYKPKVRFETPTDIIVLQQKQIDEVTCLANNINYDTVKDHLPHYIDNSGWVLILVPVKKILNNISLINNAFTYDGFEYVYCSTSQIINTLFYLEKEINNLKKIDFETFQRELSIRSCHISKLREFKRHIPRILNHII